MTTLQDKHNALRSGIAAMESVLVAFSGGVDSSLLLAVAADALGPECTALTTVSMSVPENDRQRAVRLATSLRVRHLVVSTEELASTDYARNPSNRCYFCKDNLFRICTTEAHRLGVRHIIDGANTDDLSDHRPGLEAAERAHVRHPLIEANLDKNDIRQLSRQLRLETWNHPASPCLASRIPYGTPITSTRLAQVAAGERVLRECGFKELRLRHHDTVARIEIPLEDMQRLLDPEKRAMIVARLQELGFIYVTVDLAGFRSGSLNAGIPIPTPAH